jgi:hypothetical protein
LSVKLCAVQRLAAAAGLIAIVAAAPHGIAHAQALDPSTTFNSNNTQAYSFDRGQNISVRERPRPDYQAAGIHVGGFMIYPKVTASVGYDTNVFAVQHGAVGDAIFTVTPEVDIASTWSRNALDAYVRASQDVYARYATEDVTEYGAGVSGKYEFGTAEVGEAQLTGGVDYGRYALPRSAANSGVQLSKNPIQYDYTALNAQLADTFNRLRLSVRADDQIYDYYNGQTPGGALVFEQGLNHYDATFTAKAEYAVSPDTAVFVIGAYNQRTYQLGPPVVPFNSNSSGFNVGAGANFDITHLIRGEVQLGYMDQQYVSPAFPAIRGLSAKAQLEWFPTQLTTVTATALRGIGDSGIIHSAGFLNTTGALQVDHELLRNVILSANVAGTENQYSGISRTDTIWSAGASADWLLTRWFGTTLAYTFADQHSSGAERGPSFDDNRVTLSLVFQL